MESYSDAFEPPTGLPPQRSCDHRIHLLPDAPPAAVRPYRYPKIQKDELESQCATMLEQGRPSTSPSARATVSSLSRSMMGHGDFVLTTEHSTQLQ